MRETSRDGTENKMSHDKSVEVMEVMSKSDMMMGTRSIFRWLMVATAGFFLQAN